MQIGRVMKRCDFTAGFNALDNIGSNEHTVGKAFAPMHNTMTYRVDFAHLFDNAVVLVQQSFDYQLDSNFMVGDFRGDINGICISGSVF